MKIIGSLTSPFTRLTRVVCEELQIAYEQDVTQFYVKLSAEQDAAIASYNPLGKVPVLVDGDQRIIDSRVIVRYLLQRHKSNGDFRAEFPRNVQDENVLTVILGIIDAGVLRFVVKVSHPEINLDSGYMARCRDKIRQGLVWLEKNADFDGGFGVTEAALLCALEWFEKRNIYPWREFPNIVCVHAAYCDRPSMVATRIPDAA
jgi:glutathione S-transferase